MHFSDYMGEENTIAGLFGLGCGTRSIQRQLKADTDLRFSYCLSDWTIGLTTHTYLHLAKMHELEEMIKQ